MSAIDPSAPGLPLAGGGGGGASLPTTPALALLDAGNPNVLVGLDADGVGTAVPPSASGTTVLTGDASAGRGALGLGGAATLDVGTTAGTVAAGDDGRFAAVAALPWTSSVAPVSVQTTDATQTTLTSIATTNSKGHTLLVVVQATKSDRSSCTSWMHLLSVTNASGTVTIRNTLQVALDDPGTTYAVAYDVSGTSVRVRVTGAAATTLDWSASVIAITGGS